MSKNLIKNTSQDMTKEKLRKVIGNNIRNTRESRGFSIDMLSEVLGLSTSFVGLIERGQRGTTAHNLYKISEIFNVSIDSIVFNDFKNIVVSEDNPLVAGREKINSYLYNFSAPELEFIFEFLLSLKSLQKIYNIKQPLAEDKEYEDVSEN